MKTQPKKKKLYCALVLVDEDCDVKESGAAIRYLNVEGAEETKQASMFRLEGNSNEIVEQLTQRLLNGLILLEPVLTPKEEKRIITDLRVKKQ